jgi:hypothetical protein
MNIKEVRISKEAVLSYFEVLSRYSPEEPEENLNSRH